MSGIVVGVDGSEHSLEALRWAVDEAKARGTTLRVVHSWMFPPMALPVASVAEYPPAGLKEAAEEVLRDCLATIPDDAGIEVSSEVVNDLPAQALVDASRDAELVVVGSRGRGGFRGLLLGSVSQQVAHHAHCPVVIFPHGDRR